MNDKIMRLVRWYEKDGDAQLGEEELKGIEIICLRSLFSVEKDDPMYDSYPMGEHQVQAIQPYLKHRIDPSRAVYFLEADSL